MEKSCSKCGILKPLDAFGADKRRNDGKRSACKSCNVKWAKKYRKANPDAINASVRKYARKKYGEGIEALASARESKAHAISMGLPHYDGRNCKNCGNCKKYVVSGNCVECADARSRRLAKRDWIGPEHKEKRRLKRLKNLDKIRAATRLSVASYMARKKLRVPIWQTDEDRARIKEIYDNCPEGYHVDHIIPMFGEIISGLHVPENLQYLTAEENCAKNNKWPWPQVNTPRP